MSLTECRVIIFSYFNSAGEGQYGKVYTCISVDTGELMAMKEVSVYYMRITAALAFFPNHMHMSCWALRFSEHSC